MENENPRKNNNNNDRETFGGDIKWMLVAGSFN